MRSYIHSMLDYLPFAWQHRIREAKWIFFPLEEERLWLKKLFPIQSGVALDIGANRGFYTNSLARLFESVVAFEPNPRLNLYLDEVSIENVYVVELAVTDTNGSTELRMPLVNQKANDGLATISSANDFHKSNQLATSELRFTVETTTLDTFVHTKGLKDVKFIKIDVEGEEERVLIGAKETLSIHRPTILVEIEQRHGSNIGRIHSYMNDLGYTMFYRTLSDNFWHNVNSHELDFSTFASISVSNNYLFVDISNTEIIAHLN